MGIKTIGIAITPIQITNQAIKVTKEIITLEGAEDTTEGVKGDEEEAEGAIMVTESRTKKRDLTSLIRRWLSQ